MQKGKGQRLANGKKLTKFEGDWSKIDKIWQELVKNWQNLTKFDKNCQKLTKLTRIIKTWQEMSWIHKIMVKFGHSGQILSKFVNFWPILCQILSIQFLSILFNFWLSVYQLYPSCELSRFAIHQIWSIFDHLSFSELELE